MPDAQDALDTATAQAQHAAAIAAYNARQAGNTAAYDAAIQQLYAAGYTNAASATQTDLLAIAGDASPWNPANLLGNVEHLAIIAALVLAAVIFGPTLIRFVKASTGGK